MADSNQIEVGISGEQERPGEEFVGFGVVPKPVMEDDAIAEALAIAEAIAPRTDQKPEGAPGEVAYISKLSLKQVIELTDKRLRALYQEAREEKTSLPEVLDLLDIEVELGRPERSDEALLAPSAAGGEGRAGAGARRAPREADLRATPLLRAEVEKAPTVRAELAAPDDSSVRIPDDDVDAATVVLERSRGKLPDAGEEPAASVVRGQYRDERERVVRKLAAISKGNYFDILGLPPSASDQEIDQACRTVIEAFAPEKYAAPGLADLQTDAELIRSFAEKARSLLSDPKLRERYRKIVENR